MVNIAWQEQSCLNWTTLPMVSKVYTWKDLTSNKCWTITLIICRWKYCNSNPLPYPSLKIKYLPINISNKNILGFPPKVYIFHYFKTTYLPLIIYYVEMVIFLLLGCILYTCIYWLCGLLSIHSIMNQIKTVTG